MKDYNNIFICPDDGNKLSFLSDNLYCNLCGRSYPKYDDILFEILPRSPYHFDENAIWDKYFNGYHNLLAEPFIWDSSMCGWGSLNTNAKKMRPEIDAKKKKISDFLYDIKNSILCDVSGGSGVFSTYFTQKFSTVVHCDLDVRSINEVHQMCIDVNITNLLITRCDYLQLPFFSNSFDAMICTSETFGNGYPHDKRLLSEIIRCLKPGSKFVIDLPNKKRIPVLLAILIQNSKIKNYAYYHSQIKSMFKDFKDVHYHTEGFHYVPTKLSQRQNYILP